MGLVAPAALAAQTVTGRVVDSASRRPLARLTVRLVPDTDSARDPVYATTETASDGVFTMMAPAPGRYRVRIADVHVSAPITLANVDAVDEHEYPVGAARPAADTSMYHVLHGAELDSVLRSRRPLLECQVDKKAAAVPGTLSADFPNRVRSYHETASLLAQFVVDTIGRAERSTLRIWRTADTDEDFIASVQRAVFSARFFPAVADGRQVRQLVQLPMTFTLNRAPEPAAIKAGGCPPSVGVVSGGGAPER